MKLDTNSSVESATCHGIEQVTDFSINVSAQAFSILSSGLYKNPIRAIIRELSTNAVDSHTEAGTSDKPFDVEFPTKFDPLFRIRDYGTGLSKKDVLGLYSTYFSSTKTDSNEQIGALGLGSKSPLGYTNSFNVVSYFNGKKTNFSVFIGDNGFPNIAVTGSVESDEATGLEIIIPVKEQSYYHSKWYDNAREIYQYFDTFPNVKGVDLKLIKPKYSSTIGNVRIHESSLNESSVIMGNIAYPLSLGSLDISDTVLGVIKNLSFDIYVDIGDVSFLPNREELSYDEKTKKIIVDSLELFIVDLVDDLTKEINSIKTIDDALHIYKKCANDHRDIISYKPEIGELLNKKMARWSNLFESDDVAMISRYFYGTGITYKIGDTAKALENRFGKCVYFTEGRRPKILDVDTSAAKKGVVFWVNDLKKSIITKFPKAHNGVDHSFLITDIDTVEKTVKYIKRKFNVTNRQIRFTSELDIPTVTRNANTGVLINRFRLVSYTNGYNPVRDWRWERGLNVAQVETDIGFLNDHDKVVWVEQKRSQAIGFNGNSNYDFAWFLGGTNKSVWGLKYVHGVKTKDVKDIKNRKDWIHIDDYVKQHIEKEIENSLSSSVCYSFDGLSEIVSLSKNIDVRNGTQNKNVAAIFEILKDVQHSYAIQTIDAQMDKWQHKLGIDNISEIGVDFDRETVYNDGIVLRDFILKKYKHLYVISEALNYSNSEKVISIINDLY